VLLLVGLELARMEGDLVTKPISFLGVKSSSVFAIVKICCPRMSLGTSRSVKDNMEHTFSKVMRERELSRKTWLVEFHLFIGTEHAGDSDVFAATSRLDDGGTFRDLLGLIMIGPVAQVSMRDLKTN
jgi:hypothetical protein